MQWKMIHLLGSNTLSAKIDIKSAFRTITVRVEDTELLGIHWWDKFYADCCLLFGLHSVPYIFNEYVEALEWILQHNYHISNIIHYLDDFLIAGKPASEECDHALQVMLQVCKKMVSNCGRRSNSSHNLPWNHPGNNQNGTMPTKIEDLLLLLKTWTSPRKRKTTERELLSFVGKTTLCSQSSSSGSDLRLIELSTSVKRLHHHIHLTASARADIKLWQDFLPEWNGVSLMLLDTWETTADLNLFTDASGTLGFGVYFHGEWIMGTWSKAEFSTSIQWNKLSAVVEASATWGHQWQRKKMLVYRDNQAIVEVWQAIYFSPDLATRYPTMSL